MMLGIPRATWKTWTPNSLRQDGGFSTAEEKGP
uniref:Uncharacterized protein n=1 Tax=Anguilla anguilla TaxID=7936 RepID=A0A0E9UKH4_ANGAN